MNRNILTYKKPAAWHAEEWREALPTGNGRIGAAVYGAVGEETIMINHGRLRHWGNLPELPDVSHSLPKVRALIDAGEYLEASWMTSNLLKEAGYSAKLPPPCPLCDVKIKYDPDAPFEDYSRSIDMETAQVTVQWKEKQANNASAEKNSFIRNTFVSRTHDVLLSHMTATKTQTVHVSLKFHETYQPDVKKKMEEAGDTYQVTVDGDYIFYAMQNDDGTDFGAVARVLHDGILLDTEEISIAVDAQNILIIAGFFIQESRETAFKRIKAQLAAMNENYDYYLSAHAQEHKKLFRSCDIQIHDVNIPQDENNAFLQNTPDHPVTSSAYMTQLSIEELLFDVYLHGFKNPDHANMLMEKLWRFGRYLMICGTRDVPFALYGLWGGGYNLMWSHNMANENLQMMYWHVMVGGLEYTYKIVIDYYVNMMDMFKDNARKLFGMDGIYVPAGSAEGVGRPNQIVPVIMNWTGAAGWLCQQFYNYYLFTKDDALLEEKILPFMEQTALFYENFITFETDGRIKFYPSVSPENSPMNFFTDLAAHKTPHVCPTVINATMDVSIFKELFTNLIAIAQQKGNNAAQIEKWQDLITRLPAYTTNSDGAIKEWLHPDLTDRYAHRHISHVYSVFPGTEIVDGRDDADLVAAFKQAVDLRELGAQTGWSFSHMSSIYARFGEGDKALECIETLSRAMLLNNLFTLHNDWRKMGLSWNQGKTAPVQLDANMGIVNALQEMLLFVSEDMIKILPALPALMKKGTVRGLSFPNGSIDFAWDADIQHLSVRITATRDCTFSLMLPEIKDAYVLKNGDVIKAKTLYEITLKKDHTFVI